MFQPFEPDLVNTSVGKPVSHFTMTYGCFHNLIKVNLTMNHFLHYDTYIYFRIYSLILMHSVLLNAFYESYNQ